MPSCHKPHTQQPSTKLEVLLPVKAPRQILEAIVLARGLALSFSGFGDRRPASRIEVLRVWVSQP